MNKNHNETQINGLLSPFLQWMRIRNAKPFFKGSKFLDIGSSLGEIIKYIPEDAEYVGIEGNKTYYANAKKLYPKKRFINLYLNNNNVSKLPIKGKFDTIIMLAVIEHVDDPEDILSGLKKYLAKDGVIIISTPNKLGNALLHIGSKLGIFMNEMHEHRELFTKKRLLNTAKTAGFKIKHYHSFEVGLNHLLVVSQS